MPRVSQRFFDGSDGEQRYTEAISEYGVNDAVTRVLITEVTRSANLISDAVVDELMPLYRFNDGAIQMIGGDLFWGLWASHPRFEPLDWSMFPKTYDIDDIKSRVTEELHGGDPRNGPAIDVCNFDPSAGTLFKTSGSEDSTSDVNSRAYSDRPEATD